MEGALVRLQIAAADLLSKIKYVCKTSQKAINTLVAGVDIIFQIFLDVMKCRFYKELAHKDGYISVDDLNKVIECYKNQSVFEGVDTFSKLESYLRETSGGETVLLKQAVLEYKYVLRNGIPRRVPSQYGYTVPFIQQLEQLLNCPDVLHCVDNPLPSVSGVYRTVTDGLFYKCHPVVEEHGLSTIAVMIHLDDAEPCDSLKSKANKNNLRLVYWTMGNIYPELRSTLRAINLLAIAQTKVAKKWGNDFLFEDFVKDMQLLSTEGADFNINGVKRRFYAILLFGSMDNPAAANVGGFKETHTAHRPCRSCLVTSSEMGEHFQESTSLLRKLEQHENQVKQLQALSKKDHGVEVVNVVCRLEEGDQQVQEDEDVSDVDFQKASKEFGVNGPCILSKVPHFDVTKCLPQDMMHVLNEGIVENVCRLLLKDLCLPPARRRKPLLKLSDLNHTIQETCDFGHLNANRPSQIEIGHITGSKLKQSASQMMALMRFLPFVVHGRCSDEKLQLLLKLIKVFDTCVAFEFSEADRIALGLLIEDFCKTFKRLYPNHKSLKLHCLIHVITHILLFGPLRQQWCFRYEAMHYLFTSIFPVVRSMKNPAFTAVSRHLSARNTEIKQGKESGNYLSCGDVITGSKDVLVSSLPDGDTLREKFSTIHENSVISEVTEISHNGSKWRSGVVFAFDMENSMFGRINSIYSFDGMIVFTYNFLKTKFCVEYNAFEILRCEPETHTAVFKELKYKFPVVRFSFGFKTGLKCYLLMQAPVENYWSS